MCLVLGWKRALRSLLTGAGKRRAEWLFSQSDREKWLWAERRVNVGDGREGSCGGVEFLGEGEDAVGTAWMVSVVEDFDCPNAGCGLFVFLR